MYMLPQVLDISTENFIINQIISTFKSKLSEILNKFIINVSKNRYVNIFLELQNIMNEISITFLSNYFESVDKVFKNSKKRKENYYINKSNVKRTIITIFGNITFYRTLYLNKLTGEYYFYVDDALGLEAYKNYVPIIRAILVQDSVVTNPNHTSRHCPLNILNLKNRLNESIPKQTIYKFKQDTKIRKINYEEIKTNKSLYVMVDEKWIHKQDKFNPNKKKWIMSKCFVTFTGIKRKGKRSRLTGRHIFITSSDKPWKEFMDEIHMIYNFEEINNINLLSDAGFWILSGSYELKLYSNNKVVINTCEFHVKQKINRSTTDKDLRITIANIIYEKEDKEEFIKEMDKLIESKTTDARKEKITEYKNYILRHWNGIINMKNSLCKSSMEAHIEHCIASSLSSVPKAYSENNIETYLKLQEIILNGISIFDYYLGTYNSDDNYIYNNEKEVNYSMFEHSTSNLPGLYSNHSLSKALHSVIDY